MLGWAACCIPCIYCQHSWGGPDPEEGRVRSASCTSLHFVHYTCGVDSWTWGSWAYDIYVSVLQILLCYTDISVLYSDDNFFDTTDTASPSTVVLSACHTAHFYMVFT